MTNTPIDPTKNLGDDATATFENDPKFTGPAPGSEGSSDNIEEQKALQMRDTDDTADSKEELADDNEEELDEDVVDEDEEFDDEGEEDEDDLDDDEEDDEDNDLEDDQDEVAVAPKVLAKDNDADDDAGDVAPGIDIEEDALEDDDIDTDRVAAEAHFASQVMEARETHGDHA